MLQIFLGKINFIFFRVELKCCKLGIKFYNAKDTCLMKSYYGICLFSMFMSCNEFYTVNINNNACFTKNLNIILRVRIFFLK